MFNADTWQSHTAYRINFIQAKARFHTDQRRELWDLYAVVRVKLMALNLDLVRDIIESLYSETGRPAKNQAQILRSVIAFCLLIGKTPAGLSLTKWVKEVLPASPILIALVGCESRYDLPPLGSYYDFMNRLWDADREKYSRSKLFPAGKNGKLIKNLGLDGKQVDADPDKYKTVELKDKILAGIPLGDKADSILQRIFYYIAVLPSMDKRIILKGDQFTLSGDGTAVSCHASPFGKRQKGCMDPASFRFHANCPRHYSDPDAEWGYDSHEKKHYFGRTLYMLCVHNDEFKVEVPLLLKYMGARRHDSVIFFYAADDLGRNKPAVSPANFCLDSAHDNIATYELLDHWGINALIDLNGRSAGNPGLPEDIKLNKQSHPICLGNVEMSPWGYDKIKEAYKYRCPMKCGRLAECPHASKCSKSEYGRTVYIKKNGDLRFFPKIPRDSEKFKDIYRHRTSCERVNNRVLNDYHLQRMMIRGDDHFAFWTMVIGVCIHLDAWMKAKRL